MLRKHLDCIDWEYIEMKDLHPSVFTHHIYIKEGWKTMWVSLDEDESHP